MNKKEHTNKDISIIKRIGNSKISMQIYGPHSINDDGTIIPFEDQMAIVSHHLHNQYSRYSNTYKNKGEALIKDIYNIINKTTTDYETNEPNIQYSLFSEFFSVPFLPCEHPKFTFIVYFGDRNTGNQFFIIQCIFHRIPLFVCHIKKLS